MRCLVTGASGFIGSVLVEQLRASGHTVQGWSRSDALDLDGVDTVFHLASPVDPRRDADPQAMQRDIVGLSTRVAQACLQADCRLVHVGTCEEYGDGPAPFFEDQPPQPVSPYSRAKTEATAGVLGLHGAGLRVTVARPFLTYGAGQRGDRLIPTAIRAALQGQPFPMTEGRQTRELNHVDDIARGLALCSGDAAIGRIINVGGGPELSVRALVERIFDLAGADRSLIRVGALPTRAGESRRFVGNHQRAWQMLGHRAQVSLEEGLRRTMQACSSS